MADHSDVSDERLAEQRRYSLWTCPPELWVRRLHRPTYRDPVPPEEATERRRIAEVRLETQLAAFDTPIRPETLYRIFP